MHRAGVLAFRRHHAHAVAPDKEVLLLDRAQHRTTSAGALGILQQRAEQRAGQAI
jgi:hypothetical protein